MGEDTGIEAIVLLRERDPVGGGQQPKMLAGLIRPGIADGLPGLAAIQNQQLVADFAAAQQVDQDGCGELVRQMMHRGIEHQLQAVATEAVTGEVDDQRIPFAAFLRDLGEQLGDRTRIGSGRRDGDFERMPVQRLLHQSHIVIAMTQLFGIASE